MRNPFSAIVNWVAALSASGSGAPHPIVATDRPGKPRKPQTSRKPQRSRKPKPKPSRKPKRRRR